MQSTTNLYTRKDAIVDAYRCANPVDTMQTALSNVQVSNGDIFQLVRHGFRMDLSTELQTAIRKDIIDFLQNQNIQSSGVARLCKFVYFATSITHLWGRFEQPNLFNLSSSRTCIVAYVKPNEPMSYVWFHYDCRQQRLYLIKHTLRVRDEPIKVLLHLVTVRSMAEERIAFDLSNNNPLPTTKNGSFLQIVYRTDNETLSLPVHGATTLEDMIVILTVGHKDQQYYLNHVYFSQAKPRKVFELSALLHE